MANRKNIITNVSGTFVPAPTFAGNAVGLVTSAANGLHTRVADLVTVIARVTLSAKGTSLGQLRIDGLPFPVDPAAAYPIAVKVSGLAAGVTVVQGYALNSASIYFEKLIAGVSTPLTDADCTNVTDIAVSVTYKTLAP